MVAGGQGIRGSRPIARAGGQQGDHKCGNHASRMFGAQHGRTSGARQQVQCRPSRPRTTRERPSRRAAAAPGTGRQAARPGCSGPAAARQRRLDRRRVPNPAQVTELLTAVSYVGSWERARGQRLVAFFACMYYAMMRPEEALALRVRDCHLPDKGWGLLTLEKATPTAGKAWTDSGTLHDDKGLKQRAEDEVRPVPDSADPGRHAKGAHPRICWKERRRTSFRQRTRRPNRGVNLLASVARGSADRDDTRPRRLAHGGGPV